MSTSTNLLKFLAVSSIAALTVSQSAGASAGDLGDSESFGFEWGHSCQVLEELDESLIMAMTHPSHKDKFGTFCYADDAYSCSDYSGLLYEFGSLVARSDGYCRFVPDS